MSTYLYTFRGQKVKAADFTGLGMGTIEAHLYSFSNGHAGGGWDGPCKRESMARGMAQKMWDLHSKDGNVPFVVYGEAEDLKEMRAGNGSFMPVYRNCTGPIHVDSGTFPAEAVHGLLVKNGGRLAVVSVTNQPITSTFFDSYDGASGSYPGVEVRYEVKDGKVLESGKRVLTPSGDKLWLMQGDDEAYQLFLALWAPVWLKKAEEAKQVESQRKLSYKWNKIKKEREELNSKIEKLRKELGEMEAKSVEMTKELDVVALEYHSPKEKTA